MRVYLSKYFHKTGQRRKVEIHDYDTWSLYTTLAHIIHPALVKFKDIESHGHPVDLKDMEEWYALETLPFQVLI